MSFLDRLRSKPKPIKDNLAIIGAFFVTLLIAAVWSMSLPARFAEVDESLGAIQGEESYEGGFGSFFSSAKDQFASIINTSDDEVSDEETEESILPELIFNTPPASPNAFVIDNPEQFAGSFSTGSPDSSNEVETTRETEETLPIEIQPVEPRTILIATTSSQKSE